ncbi:MAG: DUF1559 domain-containing protein [Armatimonadota bacterium]
MHRSAGFSLIELLVVIAIIAILAAMMFPVFSQAREKARSIACINNLKQISMALFMYAGDYGGDMPTGTYVAEDVFGNVVEINGYEGWANHLYPYTRNTQIFRCPSSGSTKISPVMEDNYAYNYDGLQHADLKRLEYPTELMAVMDFHDSFAIRGANTPENFFTGAGDGLQRHNDGANVAFCDGHAKFMPEGAIRAAIPQSGEECRFLGYTME